MIPSRRVTADHFLAGQSSTSRPHHRQGFAGRQKRVEFFEACAPVTECSFAPFDRFYGAARIRAGTSRTRRCLDIWASIT